MSVILIQCTPKLTSTARCSTSLGKTAGSLPISSGCIHAASTCLKKVIGFCGIAYFSDKQLAVLKTPSKQRPFSATFEILVCFLTKLSHKLYGTVFTRWFIEFSVRTGFHFGVAALFEWSLLSLELVSKETWLAELLQVLRGLISDRRELL